MKISTYDRFQASLRVPGYIERHPECKTVLELILAIEKDCGIESAPGSSWVAALVKDAKKV
jgi:hypothetical protein